MNIFHPNLANKLFTIIWLNYLGFFKIVSYTPINSFAFDLVIPEEVKLHCKNLLYI